MIVQQQVFKTDHGVRRLGPKRPLVVLDKLTMLIDDPGQGVGNDQGVIRFQSVDTETQKVGLNHVIVGRPFEVLAGGLEIDISEVPAGAHIAVGAVVPDAGILRRVVAADLLTAIGGAVVGDDEFEIPERLIEDRFDCGLARKAISVIKKEPDADKGVSTHRVMLRSRLVRS